jgi:hypothetical protein
MEAPDTVSEAVRLLAELGYTDEIEVSPSGLRCAGCRTVHAPDQVVVNHTFRFEGPSDPADEAIVLGVECPACGHRGIVVSAYGPTADPDVLEVLARLAR